MTTTEDGAYTLNGAVTDSELMAVTRNADARYCLPSANEWFKAAYYKGGGTDAGYWSYTTRSNALPSNVLDPAGANNLNYYNGGYTDPTNFLTPVGAFSSSPGPYGTFDMAGDMMQYMEDVAGSTSRMSRGCPYYATSPNLSKNQWWGGPPSWENIDGTIRITCVPEPSGLALLLAATLGPLAYAWRRRRV